MRMWWRVENTFAGRCSAHSGYGKKSCVVYFGVVQDNSGDTLVMERISGK